MNLLPDAIKRAAWFLIALCVCCAVMFFAGYRYAAAIYGAEISTLKHAHAKENQARAEAAAKELRRQEQINDQLTGELVNTKNQLELKSKALERKINEALSNDGPTYSGLGPDSLRLYACALGYACDATGSNNHEASQTRATRKR